MLILFQNLHHDAFAALRILDQKRVGLFLDLVLAVGLDDEVVLRQAVRFIDDHETPDGDSALFKNCHGFSPFNVVYFVLFVCFVYFDRKSVR